MSTAMMDGVLCGKLSGPQRNRTHPRSVFFDEYLGARMRVRCSALLLFPVSLLLAGCMVQSKKRANGSDDVTIATPLGGMSVKTDATSVQDKIGLPLYPGAVLDQKKAKDNGSADVDMNFGSFHLRVLAMSFTSTDAPEKVMAFYRKALAQYSDVIECRGKQAVGQPVKTGLGLTCDDDKRVTAQINDDSKMKYSDDETELKAGSPSRQHIMTFKTDGGVTHFGLVRLELPRDDGKGA